MNALAHLADIDPTGWQQLHRHAISVGCGRVLDPSEERLAATDELPTHALVELVELSAIAVAAEQPDDAELNVPDEPEWLEMLANATAGALRLVDRALAAHGRDTGYTTAAWLDAATGSAQTRAASIAAHHDPPPFLFQLVGTAAAGAAHAIRTIPRDRLGVPGALAETLSILLMIYAASVRPPAAP